ncbi:TRAP transporter small permease [Alkalicoccus luteus]|uniref:TRAP transporter small permease n=1 Tax=Alkalicoccus luteus TaxID=1237094 RepID=UPI004034C4B3
MKKFIENFEEIVGSILFAFMLLILVVQILSHQGIGAPLVWSEQLSKLIFIYVGYLGVISCVKDGSHVSIDVLVNRFSPAVQKAVYLFNHVLILACLILILYISLPILERQSRHDMVSLDISYFYMYVALPLLTLLMAVRLVERIVKDLRHDRIGGSD